MISSVTRSISWGEKYVKVGVGNNKKVEVPRSDLTHVEPYDCVLLCGADVRNCVKELH